MPDPSLPRPSDHVLDEVCLDVEATVSRVAKLVLHASALADRMDATSATGTATDPGAASERVRVLRDAAEAGRRTLTQVCVAPGAGGVRPRHRARPPSSAAAVPAPRSR